MAFKIFLSGFLPGVYAFVVAFLAHSCPIPVYRYALEFWEPDAYRATVCYSEALTPSQEEAFNLMAEASPGRGASANIDLRLVHADDEARLLDYPLYDKEAAGGRPWVVLQYPYIEGINEPVREGPLTVENSEALLYSPAREHLAARLSGGRVLAPSPGRF